MRVDGSDLHSVGVVGLALSRGPHGKIAFLRGMWSASVKELAVMDDHGRHVRSLARVVVTGDEVAAPTWSRSGAMLAYSSGVRCDPTASCERWNVWTTSVRSGTRRRIAVGDSPSWSRGGSQIVFEGDYATGGVQPRGPQRVLIASADGGDATTLTAGTLPLWSPRGSTVALVRRFHLTLVDVKTRNARALGFSGSAFAWSPDGQQIAYAGPFPALYVVSTKTRKARRVGTMTDVRIGNIAWSPDMRLLAWITYDERSNTDELLVRRSDGSGAARVLAQRRSGSTLASPVFTGDGTRVLFAVTH